jgi:hypothetical protein
MNAEQIQDQLRLLEIEQRRLKQQRELLEAAGQLTAEQQNQLDAIKAQERETKKSVQREKDKLNGLKTYSKEFESFSKKFRSMSTDVQNQLKGTNGTASVYLNLGRNIAEAKKIQVELANAETDAEKEALAAAQQRESLFTEMAMEQAAQAKATQKAEDDLRGIGDAQQRINEILRSNNGLTQQQKQELIDGIKATEASRLKQERLNTILEERKNLSEALPDSLKSGVEFAKKLGGALKSGAGPMVLLAALATAAIASFIALDAAATEFRKETGLTNTQTAEIKENANEIVGQFGKLGVEAKDVFDTVSALKTEFGDVYDTSQATTAALTVLGKNFGISAENAAKVQGVYERMGGLSSETAANVQMQAAKMAEMAGVAPAKVSQDIADAAEESYKFFKGDVVALNAAAIQARRLGTNLKDVLEVNRKLLDFEGTIEDELVAATFANGQFNLTQARTLAASGKQVEAQEEILRQIQRSGDFRKQDLFTQEALAKGAGMEVGEIIKRLDTQEKLASLSEEERKRAEEAIKQGLDITNIDEDQLAAETAKFESQKAQQGVVENMQNQFTAIAATLGSSLVPLLEVLVPLLDLALKPVQYMAEGLSLVVGFAKEYADILGPIVFLAGTLWTIQKGIVLWQRREAVMRLLNMKRAAAQAALEGLSNPVKALAGIAAAALVIGAASSYMSKAGDLKSPADGKTVVSTKEGGLFELSPNDDLVAAPGAANALENGTGGEGVSVNLSQLAAPLNAMIAEIRGLRADMASGKIAVYMDTEKVTSKIGRQVDQSTRNNYSLAQA